jgi:hypothetical protein
MSGGTAPPTPPVNADATDLYLLAWGRVGLDDPRVGISGDRVLLQHWVAHSTV